MRPEDAEFQDDDALSADGPSANRMNTGGGDQGIFRICLKAWGTPPAQLLNAYGQAKFVELGDDEAWKH